MKLNRPLALFAALLILALCGSALDATAQTSSRTKQVNIYLPKDGDSADPQNNPSNLQPVKRKVNAATPLRPAVEALLKGPTAAERRQGFGELDVRNIYLIKAAIKGKTAYASFAHRKGWAGWSGDLSPLTFSDAVERTLKQFPNVTRAVVCSEGIVNFGDESGGPEKKCPKF
jgi:hypothetical protein